MRELQPIYELHCPACKHEYTVEILFRGAMFCEGCGRKIAFRPAKPEEELEVLRKK